MAEVRTARRRPKPRKIELDLARAIENGEVSRNCAWTRTKIDRPITFHTGEHYGGYIQLALTTAPAITLFDESTAA
jgi:hypothetical protein